MRWLVDGYNVIRRDPELQAREAESLEAGRRALLNLIARARRAMQDEFTVVFDGARISGAAPTAGRIRVVFSRPPLTADDEIMRFQEGRPIFI
jgi:predicted RNA-binding protein with PIN domain